MHYKLIVINYIFNYFIIDTNSNFRIYNNWATLKLSVYNWEIFLKMLNLIIKKKKIKKINIINNKI